jgi:hypothetical protein
MISEETNSNLSSNDINHHLDLMSADFSRFQYDNNRNNVICHFCEKMKSNIALIQSLIKSSQIPLAISIVNDTNELFKKDPILSTVNLRIINQKRKFNSDAIAFLNLSL